MVATKSERIAAAAWIRFVGRYRGSPAVFAIASRDGRVLGGANLGMYLIGSERDSRRAIAKLGRLGFTYSVLRAPEEPS